MKKLLKLVLVLMMSISVVGCGNSNAISLDGSTSMEKLVNALKETVAQECGLNLEPQFTGSSTGLQSLISGNADIANSSRALKQEEKDQGLVENIVAIDGIAVIVDKSNSVISLSRQQLIDIYTGKIKNWKELGGSDQAIVVVGREASSGTRGAFEEILDIKGLCQYSNELNETGAVVAKVGQTKGAIGYVSFDVVEDNLDTINTVALDGVNITKENIVNNTYTLTRPFVMATKGTIDQQSEQVQQLFEFIYSEQGTEVIEHVGLVAISQE